MSYDLSNKLSTTTIQAKVNLPNKYSIQVSREQLLQHLSTNQIISMVGISEIMDVIGVDNVVKYLGTRNLARIISDMGLAEALKEQLSIQKASTEFQAILDEE